MPYPYSFIEQWWGESLTPELQKRIQAAPVSHLQSFLYDLANEPDRLTYITPRPDGVLRPLIRPIRTQASEIIYSKSLTMTLNVLLYAHEAIIESPLDTVYPEAVPMQTAQLLSIKPLVDAGAIHLAWVDSRSRHPSNFSFEPFDTARLAVRNSYPELVSEIGADELDEMILEVLGIVRLADQLHNQANPLARDEYEFKVMTAMLRAAWINREYFDLASLARMSVPSLDGKIGDLVAIRQSEESFALWREALSRAIMELARIPDDRSDWRRDAAEIVYSELEPLRQKVIRSNSRSNALSALHRGESAMLIGGAGAVAGWAAGSSILSALASSGASIGIASAADYLRTLKARRGNKAILDLALAFKPDISP